MWFSTVLMIALSLSAFALAEERKIQRAELPPAVGRTVAAESRGAAIQGLSQETEHAEVYYLTNHGKLVAYQAKIISNGRMREIQVGPDGNAVGHEE